MNLLPVRKLRIDAAGQSFGSAAVQTFEYYYFEPATYTKAQLLYTHQSGHQVPYGTREEVVADLVAFTASQLSAMYAFGSVDVEITLGMPGETATVVTFLATRLVLNYNVTEGVQKLKLSALQISSASGVVMPVTVADFGYGLNNPEGIRFSLQIIEARPTMEVLAFPCRNGEHTDFERVVGYKRGVELTVSPASLQAVRLGFGSGLEAWVTSQYKYLRCWNFYGTTDDAYREVVMVTENGLVEDRLDTLLIGRNIQLSVKDKYKQVSS
jgi:hypothetical protein